MRSFDELEASARGRTSTSTACAATTASTGGSSTPASRGSRPEGDFEGYIGSVIDITDRRLAEEALKESEARYRTQVQNAPEAIVVFDVDTGRFVEANDNAAAPLGTRRAKRSSQSDLVALSPPEQPDGRPSAPAIAANIDRTLHGEAPVFEWVHRDATGSRRSPARCAWSACRRRPAA